MNAERNFCERCGKRLGGFEWDIHTCTPPSDDSLIDEGNKATPAPRVQCRRLADGYMPCPYAEPQQPAIPAPPEAQTEAEKRAYAFGWWKAMEYVRNNGVLK